MTKRIPQPRSELSPGIRTHEAQLLAVMLRTSRLTWVFGEPGTDTTSLLTTQLLPLLQRRRSDHVDTPAATTAATPDRERRRRGVGQSMLPRAEKVLYIDSWGGNPLSELKSKLRDLVPIATRVQIEAETSLSEMLGTLNNRFSLEIVILLDRFDEFLALPADDGETVQFVNQLLEAILHSKLQASFLIAMREDARPRLERFRVRIPGFDHNVLRLTPIAREPEPVHPAATGVARPAAPEPARSIGRTGLPESTPVPPQRRGPPRREPVSVSDVYAFIEATLEKTSVHSRNADPHLDSRIFVPDSHLHRSLAADAATPADSCESAAADHAQPALRLIRTRRRTE